MSDDILVSVIIPAFNRENFISDTLESLLNQTYKNWEALIVDDGSIDNTAPIVLKYAAKDSRIKFYHRNTIHKGASVCRNIGIKKARGEYLIFVDSDDILASGCLCQRVESLKQNPEIDFGVFHAYTFKTKIEDAQLHTINLAVKNPLYHFGAAHSIWQTSCSFWKKEVVLNLNGFNENYQRFQDTEFHFRALCVNKIQYKVFPELPPDVYYRKNYEKRQEAFQNVVVENNFRFLSEVSDSLKLKENNYLFKKSITILNLFGVVQCLEAGNKLADEYLKILLSLKNEKLIQNNYFTFLKSILIFKKKGFLKIIFLKKIIIRIIYFLASQNLKKISA